jgi:FkbM family methyltransferase
VDIYGQECEAELLVKLLARLENRAVVDVGAERGAFVQALLDGGSPRIFAIEPEPTNAALLRSRFRGDARVVVHECALADVDGPVTLQVSAQANGDPLAWGHTLLERPDTEEITWRRAVPVAGRSLGSLVGSGEIPDRVGILKIDAEGSDFAVINGMGDLQCGVVMVEHWIDLPHSLGPCPWTIDDLELALRPRGFSKFAFLEHRGDFVLLKWNDADVPSGFMGNLVFLHDSVVEAMRPVIFDHALAVAARSVAVGEAYARVAAERLEVIETLERVYAPVTAAPLRSGLRGHVLFWTHPRIGTLQQHEPRPLTVPAAYFAAKRPTPAPTVSIVTPSFQQGQFLERTLFSVVSQAYPALEYVVQDGGSTDETLAILQRYEGALRRWRSAPDGGQADAINEGFAQTTGEIMAWLNADDLLLPGSLACVADYFATHPDVDVVYGNRLMIDEQDCQIGEWVLPKHDDRALTFADYVPQETMFWRRRVWESVGGSVDTSFSYALDWDLLVRFQSAGARIVRVPRYLGAFRVHGAQKTTALHMTGAVECDLIRQRLHGRPVSIREAFEEVKPYLVRSMLVDMRRRLADRLSRRVEVETLPPRSHVPLSAADENAPDAVDAGAAGSLTPTGALRRG